MQGKIEVIEEKEYQDKPYLRVQIDGKWYSAWDEIVPAILNIGTDSDVDFVTIQKGKYENITSIEKIVRPSVKEHKIDSYVAGYNDAIKDIIKNLERMKKWKKKEILERNLMII